MIGKPLWLHNNNNNNNNESYKCDNVPTMPSYFNANRTPSTATTAIVLNSLIQNSINLQCQLADCLCNGT
ncbi:unnamed protein product [Ceratitis capitata]|uniref:(Mediterranean fruit fly) hypothetical protein n=1 Tax=Ceratitis capitata TaxID=7213 RepID=A0A811U4A7_CERCA|nr:unnamed protein product [Ceratitis capitata]